MKLFITQLFFLLMLGCAACGGEATPGEWRAALPGWIYRFPADHAVHPDFKTEWWYSTGNLRDDQNRHYGYELTFFRQGVLPPSEHAKLANEPPGVGRFVQSDFKFAHFAISDLDSGKFYYTQAIDRGAFGKAGFAESYNGGQTNNPGDALAWMENWSLQPQPDGSWKITASSQGQPHMSINLRVRSLKVAAIEGTDGVSQKAQGPGNASHYYSLTRLETTGTLSLGKQVAAHNVQGQSWFDHEWASNQLGADQVGWDWFSFQFDDNTEMMLYAMRRRDGSIDPVSSGTWIAADGHTEHINRQDLVLQPQRFWNSPKTGAKYPVEWRVQLPKRQIDLLVKPRLDAQELALPQISYWEGAIAITGHREGRPVQGLGYMELTGYSSALGALRGGNAATAPANGPISPVAER